MAATTKLVCLVFVCVVLAATAFEAQAAITCGQVATSLRPCMGYLTNQGPGPLPPYCDGVKSLAAAARTTPDRQAACQCLKQAAASSSAINPGRSVSLPGACEVNIPYGISASVSCKSIK